LLQNYILEVCVDSVESAVEAQQGGANRLELCGNLIIGGTTPSIQLYYEVRKHTTLPINVLIRPRFGDFLYSHFEFEVMKNEVMMYREAKADGVVIGCLEANGKLDVNRIEELISIAKGMKVTINRAFDMLKNPIETLEQMKQLGVNTILTSGQKQHCLEGVSLIKQLIEQSEGKVNILIGAGVNAKVIKQLMVSTKSTQFHMSGKIVIDSSMRYRKEGISMGLPFFSEYQILQTSRQNIEDAKNIILTQLKEKS